MTRQTTGALEAQRKALGNFSYVELGERIGDCA